MSSRPTGIAEKFTNITSTAPPPTTRIHPTYSPERVAFTTSYSWIPQRVCDGILHRLHERHIGDSSPLVTTEALVHLPPTFVKYPTDEPELFAWERASTQEIFDDIAPIRRDIRAALRAPTSVPIQFLARPTSYGLTVSTRILQPDRSIRSYIAVYKVVSNLPPSVSIPPPVHVRITIPPRVVTGRSTLHPRGSHIRDHTHRTRPYPSREERASDTLVRGEHPRGGNPDISLELPTGATPRPPPRRGRSV